MNTAAALALFATTWLFVLTGFGSATALRNVKVGDRVPRFSVESLDGATIDTETCAGKTLLLLFVRPEQERSLAALRAAQAILESRRDSGLMALAITSKDSAREYFEQVAKDKGLTLQIAVDPDRKMYGDFGLVVSPTTLLIDASGVLRFVIPSVPQSLDRKLGIHTDLVLGRITREEHDEQLAGSDDSRSDDQKSLDRRLSLVRSLMEQGQLEPALTLAEELAVKWPDSVDVATLLGTVCLELNRTDQAAAALDPLDESRSPSPALKLAKARLEIVRGNLDRAETLLADALSSSSRKGRVLYALGTVYERQGTPRKALSCYRQALEEVYGRGP